MAFPGEIPTQPEILFQRDKPKHWEPEVSPLISSRRWLAQYGLSTNNLDLKKILPSLGFRIKDNYDTTLRHPVSSKYGTGLFSQIHTHTGHTYNITSSKSRVREIEQRLLSAIHLYRRRLDWLTSESRRTFGVIEEKSVIIVIDAKHANPQEFSQYLSSLVKVIEEQVFQLTHFNLIRVSENIEMFKEECISVSHDTIKEAVDWLAAQPASVPFSKSSTSEAVLKAFADDKVEAIYLYTEGCIENNSYEILSNKLMTSCRKIPVHVVSFNCSDNATIGMLSDLAKSTDARFHAFAITSELDVYVSESDTMRLTKKYIGGVPQGAGVREDALLIFREMEEGRNILSQIQSLIQESSVPQKAPVTEESSDQLSVSPRISEPNEQYMASKEWLQKHGLLAKKLTLTENLSSVAFDHKDGVIEMRTPESRTSKMINARYCTDFPAIKWKDGRTMHVHVTPELHRKYKQRMELALSKIQQRINWLKQGSRELFGTLLENKIYILIDTSASMSPHIEFVREKILVLMKEQLRHKEKFNIVSYNSVAVPWREHLVDASEQNLQAAWEWVQSLETEGSTNTYAALRVAFRDHETEAVYLLTDGRPDQPPKSIVAQMQIYKTIPIHTISFNCDDSEANGFLCDLAAVTGGRFHYYNETSSAALSDARESEDVSLLFEEYTKGCKDLEKLTELRNECTAMCWQKVDSTTCSRNHILSKEDRVSSVSPLPPKDLYRPDYSRPSSSPPGRDTISISSPLISEHTPIKMGGGRRGTRPKNNKSLTAGHTRTSLLRLLNSSADLSKNGWLLPNSSDLTDKQISESDTYLLKDVPKRQVVPRKVPKHIIQNGLNSRKWLQKHGLIAKKLTIIDALAPTIVSHKAKYVPILSKPIPSQVFNEVLPLAHVSSRKTNEIKLVNPSGVNLTQYEEKLRRAISLYKKRLNYILMNDLSQDEKQQLKAFTDASTDEQRHELLRTLKRADSPVAKSDALLLENEISRANRFLQLSNDLRQATITDPSDSAPIDDNPVHKYDNLDHDSLTTTPDSHLTDSPSVVSNA